MGVVQHETVLLNEAVEALVTDPKGCYVDGTYGRGGHAMAILKRLASSGCLLVIDKDPKAIAHAKQHIGQDKRVMIEHGSFAEMSALAEKRQLGGAVTGVLLDLGVSSPQLDDPARGFSFTQDGPLDMRMDSSAGMSAADWIAVASEQEIACILKDFGEERFAKRMARAIVEERQRKPIVTTKHLADIVTAANPAWEKHKHTATRAFQAIRIYINRELADLTDVLEQALELLSVGGRLVVISFHSLEDRLVKHFIRDQEKGPTLPRYLPIRADQIKQRLRHIGKAVRASDAEVQANVRARSAIMRIAEKVA